MRRLVKAMRGDEWPREQADDSVTLSFDDRRRRRIRLSTDNGEPVLLDLAKPQPLADGDGLEFDNGGWVVVRAAPEEVLEISANDDRHLARLAWHLGNRHLPTEILVEGRLRIRYDHVIEDLVNQLGARCERQQAVFQPEGGAY